MGIFGKLFGSGGPQKDGKNDPQSLSSKTDSELFLDYLTQTFGKEDGIYPAKADDGGKDITVFVYKDCPERGMVTGVTYGLSCRAHPEWKAGRPEMVIAMESEGLDWPTAALELTAYFASRKRFRYGDVFTIDHPLAGDTTMDAVFIFAQSVLEPEQASVQLRDYRVNLIQFYPFYRSELPLYEELGLEQFWKHPQFGVYDPKRPPIA